MSSLLTWPRRTMQRMYRWMVSYAETRQAYMALFFFTMAEGVFFPIPPDPLMMAIVTARPQRYRFVAGLTTLASLCGGIVGYLVGIGLYETVGQPIIAAYNLEESFAAIGVKYQTNAFATIFAAALILVPYKVISISAGVFRVPFLSFVIASILARGIRFFIVAYLMHQFGTRYQKQIEKYIDVLSLVFAVLVVISLLAASRLAK